jgi:hypothetical protein
MRLLQTVKLRSLLFQGRCNYAVNDYLHANGNGWAIRSELFLSPRYTTYNVAWYVCTEKSCEESSAEDKAYTV